MPGKAGNLWLTVGILASRGDCDPSGGRALLRRAFADRLQPRDVRSLVIGLPYWFWKPFDAQNAPMEILLTQF